MEVEEIEEGTARAFLEDRKRWLAVVIAQNPDGGFDIVLRIDGTYTTKEDAEDVAEMFRRDLRELKDVAIK